MAINNRKGVAYTRIATFISLVVLVLWWNQATFTGFRAAIAQAPACPDLVKKALESANKLCSGLKRNQACYGNALASATPKSGAAFAFSKPGDIIDLKDLQTLKLTAYDPQAGTWGVGIMRVQASLPDTAPGQNITMIVFGDAQVDDATRPGDNNKPMQAFYLRTGVGSPACTQVNNEGVLLKSPEGTQKVALTVNGVEMSVGSTVFLAAKPIKTNATLTSKKVATVKFEIHVIKGSVGVTSNGETKVVNAGMDIELDQTDDFELVGDFSDPQVDPLSEPDSLDTLPIDALDQEDQILDSNDGEVATSEPGGEEITPTSESNGDQPEVTDTPEDNGAAQPEVTDTGDSNDEPPPEVTTPPDTSDGSDTSN